MILLTLLTIMTILAVLQVKSENRKAALVFSGFIMAHLVIGKLMGGWEYYMSACAFDLCVIWVLGIGFRTRLSIKLRHAAYVSMILNLFGFAWWYGLILPDITTEMTPYFWTYRAFYSWVILILFRGSKLYVGIFEALRGLDRFRGHAVSGVGMDREEA